MMSPPVNEYDLTILYQVQANFSSESFKFEIAREKLIIAFDLESRYLEKISSLLMSVINE
jgi:hypothetical protein